MSERLFKTVVDDYSCSPLCSYYLDILSDDARKNTIQLIHELCRADLPNESAKEQCSDAIKTIEVELGSDHYVCKLVIKVMAELFKKIYTLECAIELITEHMKRKKTEDFDSLLLLSHIYTLFGHYRESIEPLKKAHVLAKQSEEPLLLSLVLVKEACSVWHLKDQLEAESKVQLCETILSQSSAEEDYNTYPFSENTRRLLDVYKTLGYMYYQFRDSARGAEYYHKALNILEKDSKSVTQLIKLETMVVKGSVYVNKPLARSLGLKVFERIKCISSSEVYLTHHSLPMIHSLQRIAYSLECARYYMEAVEMNEYSYNIGEKYLGRDHPEVARTATNIAYACNFINEIAKQSLYIERAQTALKNCSHDLTYIKLHVREISDSWSNLGKLFSYKNNFKESEYCFNEAISVNIRVYGCTHFRLSTLYNSLGYLYKRNSEYSASLDCFQKCLEVNRNYNCDAKVVQRLLGEIDKVKALKKKYFTFTRK